MRPANAEPEPLWVTHTTGKRVLGIRDAKYWKLVRAGKITTVGRRRSSRAYWPSIKAYAAELLAEANKETATAE